MRILYLTPFPPRADAPHGGARVMAQLLGTMADRHDVALLSLHAAYEPLLDESLRQKMDQVEIVRRSSDSGPLSLRVSRGIQLLAAPLRGRPTWVEAFRVREYANAVGQLIREWQPDLVQIDYHVMAQYGRVVSKHRLPLVVVEHEPGIVAARHRADLCSGARRLWYNLEARAWHRFEAKVLALADAVVVFTEEDREALQAEFRLLTVHRIPLALPLSGLESSAGDEDQNAILFVGNYRHPPNVDAARRLMDGILPEVRKSIKDARLVLIGPEGPPDWRGRQQDGVDYLGFVPEVGPHMRRAAVVAVPLRTGGGMRVKVLESMAHGKAMVASSTAMSGIGAEAGKHFLTAEDDRKFAARIVELLSDPHRRHELGRAARDWVVEHMNVTDSVNQYEALYTELVRPTVQF